MAKAKAKAKQEQEEAPEGQSKGEAALRKLFGDEIMFPLSEIRDEKPEVVPTGSPAIDAALGGGFITGTLGTLVGPSGCGKTTTGLKVCESWQQNFRRKVYYFATEYRLYPRDLENVRRLDASLVQVVRSHEKKIMTAQDVLKAADTLLRNEREICVFVDSFSMIADADEMKDSDYEQGGPAKLNRMVSSFCKNMTPILPLNRNLLIGTFHTYANIGGKTALKGSVPAKVEFLRSTGLKCNWAEPITVGEGDKKKQIGQVNHWVVERSMLPGGGTGNKADSILKWDKGIDVNAELFRASAGLGLFTKEKQGSSWLTLAFLGPDAPKVNGAEQAVDYLDEHPEAAGLLYSKLTELLS